MFKLKLFNFKLKSNNLDTFWHHFGEAFKTPISLICFFFGGGINGLNSRVRENNEIHKIYIRFKILRK